MIGLAACGSDDDASSADSTEQSASADITIADPWSRQPAEGQTTSAVYGAVTNGTDETITAISATASVSDTVELHEVLMNDEGQMSMQEKEGGYEIAAGETFVFEPGGPHIMLLDIDAATYPDTVDVTLSFDNGATLAFTADVRPIGDAMEEMDDMDDGSMDDGGMDDMDDGSMDDSEMDDSEMDDSGS
jgi:copper(I)-binding protein